MITIANLVQLGATVQSIASKLSVVHLRIGARFDIIILEVTAAYQVFIIVWVFGDPF